MGLPLPGWKSFLKKWPMAWKMACAAGGAGGGGFAEMRSKGEGFEGWGAAAGGGFAVDDLAEAAVLEENVLAGSEVVGGAGEDIRELQRGRVGAGVVDAGIAVGRDAEAEGKRALRGEGETQIGGEDDVLRLRGGAELKGAAVEREEQ